MVREATWGRAKMKFESKEGWFKKIRDSLEGQMILSSIIPASQEPLRPRQMVEVNRKQNTVLWFLLETNQP
jgi:hypothetical protein